MGDVTKVVANDGKKRDDKSSIKSITEPESPCDHQHSSYPWMSCSCSIKSKPSPSPQQESRHTSPATTKPDASVSSLSLSKKSEQDPKHTSLPATQTQATVSSLSLPEEQKPQESRNRSQSASHPQVAVSNISLPAGTPHEHPVFIPPPQHYGRSSSYLPINTIPTSQNHGRSVSYQQPNFTPSAVQQYGRPVSYQQVNTVASPQSYGRPISYQQPQTFIAELEGSPAPPATGPPTQASRPQSVPLLASSFANQHSQPLNHQASFMSAISEPQMGTNSYPQQFYQIPSHPYSPSTVSSVSNTSTPTTTYFPTPIQAYAPTPLPLHYPPIPAFTPVGQAIPQYAPIQVPAVPQPLQPQPLAPLLQEIQNILLLHFLEGGGSSLPIPQLKAHATQALQHQLKAPIILKNICRDLDKERCEEFEKVKETVERCLETIGINGAVALIPELGGGGLLLGVHVFPC